MKPLYIQIPVVCQNGHHAKWLLKIDNLDVRELGVSDDTRCGCPKYMRNAGYNRVGGPVTVGHSDPNRKGELQS